MLHGDSIEGAPRGTGATAGTGCSYYVRPRLGFNIYLHRPIGADAGTDTTRGAFIKVYHRFDSLTLDGTGIEENGATGSGGSGLGNAVLYVLGRFDTAGEEDARRRCIYRPELGMSFHQKAVPGLGKVQDTDEPLGASLR